MKKKCTISRILSLALISSLIVHANLTQAVYSNISRTHQGARSRNTPQQLAGDAALARYLQEKEQRQQGQLETDTALTLIRSQQEQGEGRSARQQTSGDEALARRLHEQEQRQQEQLETDATLALILAQQEQSQGAQAPRRSGIRPNNRLEPVDIATTLGSQITERFDDGPFPAVRILTPHQMRGVSCGLHALANLYTAQTLLPLEYELIAARQPAHSFVATSRGTYDTLEQRYGCPRVQLELVQLLEYVHSSEFAVRNLYAFSYNDQDRRLMQVLGGGEVGSPYYDAIVPTFENSVKKLLRSDNDLTIINILLQVGQNRESGHWTAVSIIKTASMQTPVLIFMDSIGNRPTTTTSTKYKEALRAIQRKIMNDAR